MSKLKVEPVSHPNRLSSYFYKERRALFWVTLFGLTFNSATVVGPILQGSLIDAIVKGVPLSALLMQVTLFLSAILLIQTTRFFKRFYVRRFANGTTASMRLVIYNNLMRRDPTLLDRENMGNLMTRAMADVDLCVEGMRKVTTEIFDTGVLMTAYLVTMLLYDVHITLFSCIYFPIAMVLAEKLKGAVYRYSTAYRTKAGQVADLAYDRVDHAMLYRINGLAGENQALYDRELEELRKRAVKATVLENALQPLYNIIALLGIVAVVYLGGLKVVSGGWTVGGFSAYLTMFTALTTKASKAAKLFNTAQKSKVSWLRIKPYLEEYQPSEPAATPSGEEASLEVKHLTFSYPGQKEPVLEDITFSAKAGEIVAVTGPIACGKSTLGFSLLGLCPYEGSIQICSKELRELTEAKRCTLISHQGHDPQLLSDTIAQNIALGRDLPVAQALEDVCFATDLRTMPQGTDTLVGSKGVRLSGGQQARISLARALLGAPPLIVLDDPFSSVDGNTEREIIKNLRRGYPKSILLLLSHRLSIFPLVDKVLLLQRGQPPQMGSHEELMRESPLYSTIYRLQHGKEEGESR